MGTAAEAKEFEGEGEAVVIGLFKSDDSKQAKAFMTAAGGMDGLPFGIATSKDVSFVGVANFVSQLGVPSIIILCVFLSK